MVFISYSWVNENPDERVLRFVADLRESGIDAQCDVMFAQERSSIHFIKMMAENLEKAEKVIIVLSAHHKAKADSFKGGVGEEYRYIISDIENNKNKYILVAFSKNIDDILPDFLRGREIIFIGDDSDGKYTKLLYRLSGTQEYEFQKVNPVQKAVAPRKI